jgi:hypothetical protein
MNMQNQFNKMSVLNVKQFQKISKNFQVLLYKFKDIQGLKFLFSNSRTFKDFQVLYEPCSIGKFYVLKDLTRCITLSQFPQTFLTNPSKLRIYLCKIPTVITNFDNVNKLSKTCTVASKTDIVTKMTTTLSTSQQR